MSALSPYEALCGPSNATFFLVLVEAGVRVWERRSGIERSNSQHLHYSYWVIPIDEEIDFFLMASLSTRLTGLPFIVWLTQRGNAKHDIRVKVASGPKVNPDELVNIAIRPTVHVVAGKFSSRDLEALKAWIDLNRDVLIAYWDGDLLTDEALDRVQGI